MSDFVADLIESQNATHVVAKWLRRYYNEVIVNPLKIRPSFEERAEYSDGGDIIIVADGKERIIEVKHVKDLFTSLDECRRDIIVDDVSNFDKKKHDPFAYVFWLGFLAMYISFIICDK